MKRRRNCWIQICGHECEKEERECRKNVTMYDAKPLLEKEVFALLKENGNFIKNCTIMNDTLAWDISGNRDSSRYIDIDPDMLYMLDAVKDNVIL